MKHWIKRTLFSLLGASILVGGLTACGHQRHAFGSNMTAEGQAKMREKIIERVSSKLDLNADQNQRLNVLADKLQAQRTALVGQTTNPRADMQALIAGEKFDRSRAQTLLTEKTAAITSKSPDVITALADFYDSLTPVQQTKAREAMRGRHGWWYRG